MPSPYARRSIAGWRRLHASHMHPPLRVGVVQFAPKLGQVQENIAKARALCAKLKPGSLDLLCLPEMALTGYAFTSAAAILPFLEHPRSGPTPQLCAELARQLRCYVFGGYPERLEPREVRGDADGAGDAVDKVGANSAVVCGPDGQWVAGYRKTNLFSVDTTWARAGTGFATLQLPPPLGTVTLAICMDLNAHPPGAWTTLAGPYEVADHCIETQTDTLVLLNAWLAAAEDGDSECGWQTLNFWAARLRPLWAKPGSASDSSDEEETGLAVAPLEDNDAHRARTTVIICNRSGDDNGVTYAGSSALFRMDRGSGHPVLLKKLGRAQEDAVVWLA